MKERRFTPCNLGRSTICLGKQGESNALRIEFDCSAWLAEYPDAVIVLYHFAPERAADNPIRPVLGEEGTDRVWHVSEGDTANAGNGVIELVLEDEFTGSKIKSATGYTTVTRSPSAVPMSEGGTGEDGGYYKPSVSSAGDLSWTPSKAGMPSVNTVNIKGPAGKDGKDGAPGAEGPTGPQGPAGTDGKAATLEIVGADSLPYGSVPTVTEADGSTAQSRLYRLGIPEGKPGASGSGEGGSSYTLPIASATTLGGVKPAAKTDEMTQEVGVDAEGKLWGLPGGGTDGWKLIKELTLEEDVREAQLVLDNPITTEELVFDMYISHAAQGTTGNGRLKLFFNGNYTAEIYVVESGVYEGERVRSWVYRQLINTTTAIFYGCRNGDKFFMELGYPKSPINRIQKISVYADSADHLLGIGTNIRVYARGK